MSLPDANALDRPAEITSCYTEDNGKLVEIDGVFEVEPLVRTVLRGIGRCLDAFATNANKGWWTMRRREAGNIWNGDWLSRIGPASGGEGVFLSA